MPERHLILGGARSGKTNHAITLAASRAAVRNLPVVYVATAEALDDEMRNRIGRHRAERPQSWQTVEAPRDLAAALRVLPPAIVVVDCLTLWLSNALLPDFDEAQPNAPVRRWDAERQPLCWLAEYRGRGAVGLERSRLRHRAGVGARAAVPGRAGALNQDVAAVCDA